jgi:hypothetical protein
MEPGQQPWAVVSGLPAWQVTQLPRPAGPGDDVHPVSLPSDDETVRRARELVSAYWRSAPVAVAWVRERAGGPVRVITAGPGVAAGDDGRQDVLTLPAGARGWRLPDGQAAALLAGIPCWTQLAGVSDVLLAGQDAPAPRPGDRAGRSSLEDGLLSAWLGPFGWLLLAEPVDAGTLEELTSQVARAQLEAQHFDNPRAQLAERRAGARHAELRQAASTGLWRVHLLAGAGTPQQAAQVAGLLRASTDLAGLPYALLPARAAAPPPEHSHERPGRRSLLDEPELQWAVTAERQRAAAMPPYQGGPAPAQVPASPDGRWPAPQPAAPFHGSTALVAALARMPAREVPGLRMVARPQFDLTPETSVPSADGAGNGMVRLGEVLDWNRVPCGDLALAQASLNRHVFVCGATGAGKSQTVRNLLEQATRAGIPWLVIEPAKAEYRLMAARLPGGELIRIRPGDLEVPPAGVNPLEPAAGPDGVRYPLQAHADLVRALFLAAFEAGEPFPQVLAAALTRCYEQAGWDLVTGQALTPGTEPGYPGLAELQAAAMSVVEEIGYGREVTDNVRGFVTVRIGSLRLGTTGRFLEGGHRLDFGALLDSNVVLEIEDCGDDREKAFLTGTVLIRLAEYLRMRQRAEGPAPSRLRHLTVVEEAHRLLRQPPPGTGSGPAAHAVEMFAGLLAEIRAYGEGLIIAEQIPSKLIPDVIKNTAVKVVHRLPALDDRDTVGATMNLTPDQSRYLVTLVPGEAAVHADGMDYPLLVRVPDGTQREISIPAQAVPPSRIIAPRSATCGARCQQQPCTLGQMRAAQNAATRDLRITLWAELAVVGHLTGWLMPVPGPALTADLAAMDERLRDCALSHAVDAAVASRATTIAGHVSGSALATHVAAAMRGLGSQQWLCTREEPQWLAPAYRWALVLDSLRGHERDHPGTGPHRRTAEWEAAYGRAIPGSTCAQQAETVRRWDEAAHRDQQQLRITVHGAHAPSEIEQAIGVPASDPGWEGRLTDALADLPGTDWPLDQLGSATEEAPS